jgi:hypothetical protein
MAPYAPRRFPITFDPTFLAASRLVGVRPSNAWVEVGEDHLEARFGPWTVRTPLDNVLAAEVTGPYAWPKVIGPAHLSLTDRGLTFGGNAERGVCIRFHRPVAGIDPLGLIRHPGLTVTVGDPEGLRAALDEHIAGGDPLPPRSLPVEPTRPGAGTDASTSPASRPPLRAVPDGTPDRPAPGSTAAEARATRRAARAGGRAGPATAPATPAAAADATARDALRHRLAGHTVVELRALARRHGVPLTGATRKADLVLALARDLPPDALDADG